MTKLAVIGTGYVGLSTGLGMALLGHEVTCVDTNQEKIGMLQEGISPIGEPGLNEALLQMMKSDCLSFHIEISMVHDAEIVFLCLPTPQGTNGSADLSYVESVALQLGAILKKGAIVVNKSTVPVGTSKKVTGWIGREDVSVVSNPEFLRQGTALADFLKPSRIVIGGDDQDSVQKVADLYASVSAPILKMTAASAELLKYAANSFLATKLTFVNAIADICEVVDADIFEVLRGFGMDDRIGNQFLNPGPGWGGSCFPKDTRALVNIAESEGYDFALLRGVIQTNDDQYERIATKVVDLCGGRVEGKTIATWGLTFKAHTDDLRDSPSISILTLLHEMGAHIRAFDPAARGVDEFSWIEVCASPIEACVGADVLVVLTEWPEFAAVDPYVVSVNLNNKAVVDGRNILDIQNWKAAGFEYRGVGRN